MNTEILLNMGIVKMIHLHQQALKLQGTPNL